MRYTIKVDNTPPTSTPHLCTVAQQVCVRAQERREHKMFSEDPGLSYPIRHLVYWSLLSTFIKMSVVLLLHDPSDHKKGLQINPTSEKKYRQHLLDRSTKVSPVYAETMVDV